MARIVIVHRSTISQAARAPASQPTPIIMYRRRGEEGRPPGGGSCLRARTTPLSASASYYSTRKKLLLVVFPFLLLLCLAAGGGLQDEWYVFIARFLFFTSCSALSSCSWIWGAVSSVKAATTTPGRAP